jgi:hypothetical protein
MHSTNLPPAGKGVLLESLSDGEYVRTKVVEPVAVRLVDEGVYSGYSVGISRPRIDRDVKARNGRIVAGKIVEISLVDRPALPTAKFAVLKSSGNGLAFIGKSETVPARFRPDPPKPVRRYQRRSHVTIHARDTHGVVRPYEGVVTRTGVGSVEIDTTGFAPIGRRERFTEGDIVAAYKGSAPDLIKSGSTEDSVANDTVEKKGKPFPGAAAPFGKKKPAEGSAAEEAAETPAEEAAEKADMADCDKCKGAGFIGDAKCDKCAGSGKAEIVKGADMSSVLEDINAVKEDIKDVENDLEDITGQKADGDDKDDEKDDDDSDSSDDSDDDSDSGGDSAPKFGGKVSKRAHIEQREGNWVVLKGTEVLGTHPDRVAAEAHQAQFDRERKANKAARKAAKVAAATLPKGADEIPWLLRRAHDFTCPVYKTESVEELYPSIEKSGVFGALNAGTRNAVYTALAGAVGTDAGTGAGATGIYALGKSLYGLQAFLDAADGEVPGFGATTVAAREELHEAFKAENPILGENPVMDIPKPSETITPGQFKRPYISAGHQKETASAAAAHIPETTHPISASDFSRGPLTDGHQRYLKGALADIHDGLAAWKPDLCRMDANGSFAFDRQPGLPMVAQMPNGAANSPVNGLGNTTANGMPGFTFAPAGAPVAKAISEEELSAIIAKAMEPTLKKVTTLQEEIDRLGAQPDPAEAANRGIAGAEIRKVAKVSEANEAQQEAARGKRANKIEFLSSLARNGSPDQRIAAQERLNRMGVEVQA